MWTTTRRRNNPPSPTKSLNENGNHQRQNPNRQRDKWLASYQLSRLALALRVVGGLLATVILLDMAYLTMETMRFKDPCLVARDAAAMLIDSPRQMGSVKLAPLPKIIHQQWKDETIPTGSFSEYHNHWKRLYPEPEYKHILWTDVSGRQLIADQFPWFLEAYDNYPLNIQRADTMRYFILYTYGGIYADLDYEPFVNFWDALPQDRVGFVESPYKLNEKVQNSLMSSPQRDPFWNVTFDVIYKRRDMARVLASTGPTAMDAAIDAAPQGWVHILPCENFQRIPLGAAGAHTPISARITRAILARTPLVKTCGDWSRTDDCHFGLHHNAVSYMAKFRTNLRSFLHNI